MGTTKVKVIDLSADEPVVKASRKAAQKIRPVITDTTESTEKRKVSVPSLPSEALAKEGKPSAPSVITKQRARIETEEKPITGKRKPAAPSLPSEAKAKGGAITKRIRGKKYRQAAESIDKTKPYSAKEALALLSKTKTTKFDPTVEIHVNVTQKNIRGSINFPHPIGEKKEKRYLVFTDKRLTINDKHITAATDTAIDDIAAGRLKPGRDFNSVLASPKFMPQLASVAKILGPAGMMPNPKNGTITDEPEKIFGAESSGAFEFRSDPQAPIVHLKLGKLSAKPADLEENLKAAIAVIGPSKIKKAIIKSTMSPSIRLDVSSI